MISTRIYVPENVHADMKQIATLAHVPVQGVYVLIAMHELMKTTQTELLNVINVTRPLLQYPSGRPVYDGKTPKRKG